MIWTTLLVCYSIGLMRPRVPFSHWWFASHKTNIYGRPLSAYCILGGCGPPVSWWGYQDESAADHEIAFTLKGWPREGWAFTERPGMGWPAITEGQMEPWQNPKPLLNAQARRSRVFSVPFYGGKNWSSEWLNDLLKKVQSKNRYNAIALDSDSLSTRQEPKATPSSFPLKQTLSLQNLSRFFRLAPKLIKVSFLIARSK